MKSILFTSKEENQLLQDIVINAGAALTTTTTDITIRQGRGVVKAVQLIAESETVANLTGGSVKVEINGTEVINAPLSQISPISESFINIWGVHWKGGSTLDITVVNAAGVAIPVIACLQFAKD